MELIGIKDGHEIKYDVETDTVSCKDNEVNAVKLLEAYKGSLDRVSLGPKLVFRKHEFGISVGCLDFTHEEAKSIRVNIIKIKLQNKKQTLC